MKKYKVHIIWAVIVVVALVGGIFYGKSSAASNASGRQVVRKLDARRALRTGRAEDLFPARSFPLTRTV